MSITLFIRKRRVLLVIFLISLTYFIIATYTQYQQKWNDEEDIVHPVRFDEILKTVRPVEPRSDNHNLQSAVSLRVKSDKAGESGKNSTSKRYTCRNSVQGRSLIADERGYLCDRFDTHSNGCCKLDASSTVRYSCDSCNSQGCCSLYEQCVSCCLHPQKLFLLRKVLEKKPNNINRVYSLITDHFDLCLTKCRTSSESVRHENSYIDSQLKYCYGAADNTANIVTHEHIVEP